MNRRKLIEKEEWYYYLYKLDDYYELLVPIPNPPPGFDVIHVLTSSEEDEFEKAGINALRKRIEDMQINSTKYKMNSWR